MNDTNLKYSKLNVAQTAKIQKSRSIDFSDLAWFPRTPKSFAKFIHTKEAPPSSTKTMVKGDRVDSSPIKTDQRELPDSHVRVDSPPIKTDPRELADRQDRVDSSPTKTDKQELTDRPVGGDSSPIKTDQQELADRRDRNDNSFPVKADKREHGSKGSAPALRRNSSVSAAMKTGVLSMRRSSSVSAERYSRIYDQSVPIRDEDEEESGDGRSGKKQKQRGGKILKACKRFLGLKK